MPVQIYILSRPSIDNTAFETFLRSINQSWNRSEGTPVAEEVVEIAGRLCTMSFGKKQRTSSKDFVNNIIASEHGSVLEHINWTFIISGISRSCSHQIVRHRIGFSVSQLSQERDGDNISFTMPNELADIPEIAEYWKDTISQTKISYETIINKLNHYFNHADCTYTSGELKRKINSIARSILPNAATTMMMVTANARALRHFLHVRGSTDNGEEVRRLCVILLEELVKDAPMIFHDFSISTLSDGSPYVSSRIMSKQ